MSGSTSAGRCDRYGTTEGCPDDSLNVGTSTGLPVRGTDVHPDGVFIDQQTGGDCTTDVTVPDEFSLDACDWAGLNPLARFVVKK